MREALKLRRKVCIQNCEGLNGHKCLRERQRITATTKTGIVATSVGNTTATSYVSHYVTLANERVLFL